MYLKNRDLILKKQNEYNLVKIDKLRDNNKILTTCALCGITHTKVNKSHHLKSNKNKQGLILSGRL
jgi:hypothetical protein